MDTSILCLHTAARRFCQNQFSHWANEYQRLVTAGQDRVEGASGTYSRQAYRLFPRYRLDDAIQTEVERLSIDELPSLQGARQRLLEAGNQALPPLLKQFNNNEEAIAALNEELDLFERYVRRLDGEEFHRIEPLPYRRVLRRSESSQLWEKLKSTWSVGAATYWYPLSERPQHIDVIAFHDELWQARNGTDVLLRALRERGISRCLVLREEPPDFEIDLSLVDPVYDGSESFVTSGFDWLLYASHESSISVAGWLADSFRHEWPDWRSLTYGGPFHTGDLRGTWEFPTR